MYKVAFIDNETAIIHNVQSALENQFTVISYPLEDELQDMVELLLESDMDAYIFDFNFSDAGDDHDYNGVDLYNEISQHRPNFPMVILTGYEDEVIDKITDPFHLAAKPIILNDESERSNFTKKLRSLIQSYKQKIEETEEELRGILQVKNTRALTPEEYNRLLELDTIIDQAVSDKYKLPLALKDNRVVDILGDMLKKTNEILKTQNDKKK